MFCGGRRACDHRFPSIDLGGRRCQAGQLIPRLASLGRRNDNNYVQLIAAGYRHAVTIFADQLFTDADKPTFGPSGSAWLNFRVAFIR